MAEATPQKRVLPARERAESSAKRRAASPATPATPATEPRQKRKYTKRGSVIKPPTPVAGTPTPSTPVDKPLPTKIQTSEPLPTSPSKPLEKLSDKEYQSIAESAVVAASLHRSRMQWLCDGIFKRYWTKPVKRKGVIEQPPGNPDAKSMSKLGNATMTIEPHTFDVTFYTVKDTTNPPVPYYRHPNQHTVNKPNAPSPAPQPLATSLQPTQPTIHPPTISSKPAPIPPPTAPASGPPPAPAPAPAPISSVATPIKQEQPLEQKNPVTSNSSAPATPAPPPPPYPVAHPPTQSVAPSSSGPTRPAADPVIQMLAARAATDNRLKELMKVVATSQASNEQLKEFQAHIDEFNRIIKQQDAKKAESNRSKPPPTPTATHPATYNTPSRPHPGPPSSMGGPMHMAPPSYASTPPAHRPEPYIKHIVVEFHSAASFTQSASTDRWLFPEHAILDIKTGGMEMIASFFVVRKGEDISKGQGADTELQSLLSSKFKDEVEYYQPVTVQIKATQHKTIETIARAAKPLPECQTYMTEVIEKKTRAPREFLVHRLPREKTVGDGAIAEFVDSAVEMSNDEDDELKDVYGM